MGLDRDDFIDCLDEGRFLGDVDDDVAYGTDLGVRFTPSVVIIGQLMINPLYGDISQVINAILDIANN